jgi:hypothetical protein
MEFMFDVNKVRYFEQIDVDLGWFFRRKSMAQFSYCGWASMCLESMIRAFWNKLFATSNYRLIIGFDRGELNCNPSTGNFMGIVWLKQILQFYAVARCNRANI